MEHISHMVTSSDHALFYYLNNRANCRSLDLLMPLITNLGGAAFSVLSCLFLLLLAEDELYLAVIRASLALLTSFVWGYFLKKVFTRPRPYQVIPHAFTGGMLFKDYSFPSGHTTAAFSLAVSYSLAYTFLAVPLILCGVLVGVSRVYLGQHYPTDVLAGGFLGSTAAIIVNIAL